MTPYSLPDPHRPATAEPGAVYTVASGDLRPSANTTCWPTQRKLESDLTAALRIADDFGLDAVGIQYQQGLKKTVPASDLAEGLLNNVERAGRCAPRPRSSRSSASPFICGRRRGVEPVRRRAAAADE
jgi:hypothetical protein